MQHGETGLQIASSCALLQVFAMDELLHEIILRVRVSAHPEKSPAIQALSNQSGRPTRLSTSASWHSVRTEIS